MPTLTCSSVLYLYLSFNSISVHNIRNTVVSDGKRARFVVVREDESQSSKKLGGFFYFIHLERILYTLL